MLLWRGVLMPWQRTTFKCPGCGRPRTVDKWYEERGGTRNACRCAACAWEGIIKLTKKRTKGREKGQTVL